MVGACWWWVWHGWASLSCRLSPETCQVVDVAGLKVKFQVQRAGVPVEVGGDSALFAPHLDEADLWGSHLFECTTQVHTQQEGHQMGNIV